MFKFLKSLFRSSSNKSKTCLSEPVVDIKIEVEKEKSPEDVFNCFVKKLAYSFKNESSSWAMENDDGSGYRRIRNVKNKIRIGFNEKLNILINYSNDLIDFNFNENHTIFLSPFIKELIHNKKEKEKLSKNSRAVQQIGTFYPDCLK